MVFKTKKRKLSYKANVNINEKTINQVNYTKFLGLYIDEELTWKYRILKPCHNESGKNCGGRSRKNRKR